jgi:hypothetical protein
MSEEKLNLIQKLAKIRSIADVAVKDKRGYNYSYAELTQILAQVKAGMKKYGISLIPMITPETSEVSQLITINSKFTKTGEPYEQKTTEMLYCADMVFRWVDDENPEDFLDVPWVVTGSQADPSQAFGSAMTYCTRYFLTNFFQIAQAVAEDVDAYRSRQKEAEVSEEKAVAEEIIRQFDAEVKTYLADHADQSDDVKKFIQRYVKSADYFKIKEPKLAAKLLEDFRNNFINT